MNRSTRTLKAMPMLVMLAFCITTFHYSAKAQLNTANGSGGEAVDMLGISAGGGYTFSHSDFEWTKTIPSPVFYVSAHYFSLDFLSISLEVQKGLLKGGAKLNDPDRTKTGFENNFTAGCVNFRFFPIALAGDGVKLDGVLKVLASIYGGTGAGYLYNSVKANNIVNSVYGVRTRYVGGNFFIPLELGTAFPVANIGNSKLMLNINLRTNLCFSDEIDGYQPTLEANQHNDAYSTLTFGLIYKFRP